MIEATHLRLPKVDGLDYGGEDLELGNGLRVVIGPNNSGKTRFLHAIRDAEFVATVPRASLVAPEGVQADWLASFLRKAPSHTILWGRDIPLPGRHSKDSAVGIRWEESSLAQLKTHFPGLNDAQFGLILSVVAEQVQRRPALVVSTQRYFADEGNLTTEAQVNNPDDWPVVVTAMERSPEPSRRQAFLALVDAFAEVTEGLSFRTLGEGTRSAIYIVEPGSVDRRLSQCGDGLRDLIGILLHLVQYPRHELLIDEPGLRLHPATQRRLLRLLSSEAKTKPIWVASHEGVFASVPNASGRYFVSRAQGLSAVRKLADRTETLEALALLGWRPEDAFISGRVLFCEGHSDRIVLEDVLRELSARGGSYSDVAVADLKGVSELLGGRADAIRQRMDLIRRVVPQVTFYAICDADGKPEHAKADAERSLRAMGITSGWWPSVELENLWLDDQLISVILEAHSDHAAAQIAERPSLPDLDQIRAQLQKDGANDEKGSDVLAEILRPLSMKLDKVLTARAVVSEWRRRSPKVLDHACSIVESVLSKH